MAIRRSDLQPASYNGVEFHVEQSARNSGRRNALHEFPRRDTPYAEDMGRRARKFSVSAYIIGPNFAAIRDELIEQLELEGNGILMLPTDQAFDTRQVLVDSYSVVEKRTQGFYVEVDMVFVEAGEDLSEQMTQDTQGAVSDAADSATGTSTDEAFSTAQNNDAGSLSDTQSSFSYMGSSDLQGLNV